MRIVAAIWAATADAYDIGQETYAVLGTCQPADQSQRICGHIASYAGLVSASDILEAYNEGLAAAHWAAASGTATGPT